MTRFPRSKGKRMTCCCIWLPINKMLNILFLQVDCKLPTMFVLECQKNNTSYILLQMEFGVRLVAQEDPIIPLLSWKTMVM